MPFADYSDFDACVSKNQDKQDPEAYCAVVKRKTEGEMSMEDAIAEVRDMMESSPHRLHVGRQLTASSIERIEEDDGSIRYKNVELLGPGEWTDAKSRTTYYYSPEGIKNSVNNWKKNKLYLNHDGQETILADIGEVDTDSVHVSQDGKMVGDLIFYNDTQQSQDAEAIMARAYESRGERSGDLGPSVEIADAVDEWHGDRGMNETVEMTFGGVGIVTDPASRNIMFEDQMAMSASDTVDGEGVRVLQKAKDSETISNPMTESDNESLSDKISQLNELQDEVTRSLQDDGFELVANLLEDYLNMEDTTSGDVMADVMAWADENAGEDAMGALEEAAQAVMETSGAESLDELSVETVQGVLSDMMAQNETETEGDGEPEDGGGEETEGEMSQELETLQSRVEELETHVSNLSDVIEEQARSLQDLADRPAPRALAEPPQTPTTDNSGNEEEAEDLVVPVGSGPR